MQGLPTGGIFYGDVAFILAPFSANRVLCVCERRIVSYKLMYVSIGVLIRMYYNSGFDVMRVVDA